MFAGDGHAKPDDVAGVSALLGSVSHSSFDFAHVFSIVHMQQLNVRELNKG